MDDREPDLGVLAELARTSLDGEVDGDVDARGRAALVARVSSGPPAPSRKLFVLGGLAAAACAVVGAFALWTFQPLRYAIDGGDPAREGYVHATAEPSEIVFDDGTRITLEPGASMRIVDVTRDGARVLLEDGRASFSVTRRLGARWSVEAGPFAIVVFGTTFDVVWSSREEQLEVRMREGDVTVQGPRAPAGVPLSAGQRLRAHGSGGDLEIVRLAAAGEPEPALVAAPDLEPDAGEAVAVAPTGSAQAVREPEARPSWSRRVASGEHAAVLVEAEQRGIDATLQGASLDDLVAFADAARYGRRGDLSQRAQTAIRSRFAGSPHARTAAFLLGRMADDGGQAASAIGWYDRYLAESPGGTFAAEALGRKMLAVRRTSGDDAARPLAEAYERRYPRGAHAALAKEILRR